MRVHPRPFAPSAGPGLGRKRPVTVRKELRQPAVQLPHGLAGGRSDPCLFEFEVMGSDCETNQHLGVRRIHDSVLDGEGSFGLRK